MSGCARGQDSNTILERKPSDGSLEIKMNEEKYTKITSTRALPMFGKIYDHQCDDCKIRLESREATCPCPKCGRALVNVGFSITCAPTDKGVLSRLRSYLP